MLKHSLFSAALAIKVAPLTKLIEPVKAVEEQVVGGAEALPCSLCEIVVGYAESYGKSSQNAHCFILVFFF